MRKVWVAGMCGALALAGTALAEEPGSDEKVKEGPRLLEIARRPYLGVQLVEITKELAAHYGAGQAGVLVGRVEADSPAARAGFQVGDVITAVDGKPVDGAFELARAIRDRSEGSEVAVDVVRNGGTLTLRASVELRERPALDLSGLRGGGIALRADGELFGRHLGKAVDPQVIEDAVRRATQFLESDEWKAKIASLHRIEDDVEERMKSLEARLRELEKQLEAKGR